MKFLRRLFIFLYLVIIVNFSFAELKDMETSSSFISATFKEMSSLRNYYDFQSNGTPVQIWQDPDNVNNIHAVYTFSSQPTVWDNRTVQYFFSSDKGLTWNFICNVPSNSRAGFGTITGTSDGKALIACHSSFGSSTNIRTQIFINSFPGSASFTNLDPGGANNWYILPRIIATQNIALNNKFVFLAAINSSTIGTDSAFYNVGKSFTANLFNGYKRYKASPVESYCIARGTDGRIGIAYINDGPNDYDNYEDIYYMETTNSGESFSEPLKIFDASFVSDSLMGYSGISIVFRNNTPCVVFELIKQQFLGVDYLKAPNKILFWSPDINNGNCVKIADQYSIPYNIPNGTPDREGVVGRPSIGISGDGSMLLTSLMSHSSVKGGTDSTTFNDIFITRSINGGTNWTTPERLTPTNPRNDWTFANISPGNDFDASNCYFNLIIQKDTIPGSNTNHLDDRTNAHPYFIRVAYSKTFNIPAVPNLIYPENNSVGISNTPVLQWQAIGDATGYNIQISTNVNFNTPVFDQNVTGFSHPISSGILLPNTVYYWRIKSINSTGSSGFSSVWNFKTSIVNISMMSEIIPTEYKLFTNYPNPFNPTTKIKFDLPKSSFVKINIFDVTGRMISELANTNLQAGSYETEFNGANLSSGIYYYRIEAGSFVETKKMILVK